MPLFAGIDLGTTNSAAAVFDGEVTREVRGLGGGSLTPSVVHLGPKGRVTVGERARSLLDRDPGNARTGFKRLLGTSARFLFPAARKEQTPTDLSAELLRALRASIQAQTGVEPEQAVITVPALFELPQCRATSEAALLAGFTRVELVQEPVASALAAGWAHSSKGRWLVFDLGGGTFDATLLEESDGFLRVVGHDGHNFLGGRDMDRAIYDWLRAEHPGAGLPHPEADLGEEAQSVLRTLLRVCEEAKIEVSHREMAVIAPIEALVLDGEELLVEAELSRSTLERLIAPTIQRAIGVCHRLLAQHELGPEDLEHVVMVGGPAAIPFVRRQVEAELGRIAQGDLDPMTLVARGAALQAAALGLPATAPARGSASGEPGTPDDEPVAELHLRHPSMCRDRSPFLVGQVLNPGRSPLHRVQARREGWTSDLAVVDADSTFVLELSLDPKLNRFEVSGFDEAGGPVRVTPSELSITHGVSIGDPPVARSVGVARSSDDVTIYFERGHPLPAERSFQFFTVETVQARTDDCIRIPLVQGEFELAHLCQRIGEIVIDGGRLERTIETGSEVEITLRMDRGGQLEATARFPEHRVEVRSVAQLLTPEADPEAMRHQVDQLGQQLEELRSQAFALKDKLLLKRLAAADAERARLSELVAGLTAEAGALGESAQRARRDLLELSGEVFHLDQEVRWPEVEEEIADTFAVAAFWVSGFGQPEEQRLLDQTHREIEGARAARSARRISRLLRRARSLMGACFNRSDAAVTETFREYASRSHEAMNPEQFRRLIERGHAAVEQGDMPALRNLSHQLSTLLPGRPDARERAFSSGVE